MVTGGRHARRLRKQTGPHVPRHQSQRRFKRPVSCLDHQTRRDQYKNFECGRVGPRLRTRHRQFAGRIRGLHPRDRGLLQKETLWPQIAMVPSHEQRYDYVHESSGPFRFGRDHIPDGRLICVESTAAGAGEL